MGWLADWKDAEDNYQRAAANCPNCTQKMDCPARGIAGDDHFLGCKRHRQDIAAVQGFDSWDAMMRDYWKNKMP